MTDTYQTLDGTYSRVFSVRMHQSTYQAVEACRQQFNNRDQAFYTFNEVLVFLLETYLYEREQITSPPVLSGRGARKLSRRKLEEENAALRRHVAALLNQQSQEGR